MAKKKALVLSGGGGRGAYHIGVIEALVAHGWMEDGVGPDIIAGTSIGAINAAALASGMTVRQLRDHWLSMHTEDVHRLSRDIPAVSRPLLRFLLRSVLTSDAHGGPNAALPAHERDVSAQTLFERMRAVFQARPFRSLLSTTPWRHTLANWMNFERINGDAAPALLLAATNIQSGGLQVFCNRDRPDRLRDTITLDHLMASSSIPVVYPWTELDGARYWDGAVLANTPLGPVIDLAGDDDVDIMVVMMTPWHEDASQQAQLEDMPQDLVQALSLTLDWTLLASYRSALKSLRAYNRLADAAEKLERAAQHTGDASMRLGGRVPRRISEPTVIAPPDLISLEWIIDYEQHNHRVLFAQGRADAERALQGRQLAVGGWQER